MKNGALAFAISFLNLLWGAQALAIPAPPSEQELVLRLDFKNLTGPDGEGLLTKEEMTSLLVRVNEIWSQCSVRFVTRLVENVNARSLGVPYQPKSQDDLSRIAAALNPGGFDHAIPLTVAGPWEFFDRNTGLFLHGLGWVFTRADGAGIERIGAMIDARKIRWRTHGEIIAHELGHTLSLSHHPDPANVMNGDSKLTPEQCTQARGFSLARLPGFLQG